MSNEPTTALAPAPQNGALAEDKKKDPAHEMRALINRSIKQLVMAMPKHVSAERIARVAMTEITRTPKLADCTPASFMACLLTAAQLGLEPGGPLGHGWLIPRWNSKRNCYECTWQTGYQGLMDLAYRSRMVVGIDADVVREGDHFVWCKGLHPQLDHRHSAAPNRHQMKLTHAWAVVRIRDAESHFEVLPFVEIERRRMMNDAEKKGFFSPWKEHYDAMAKKTAIKAALKLVPKSAEMIHLERLEAVGTYGMPPLSAVDEKLAQVMMDQNVATQDDELVGDDPPKELPAASEQPADPAAAALAAKAAEARERLAKGADKGAAAAATSTQAAPPPAAAESTSAEKPAKRRNTGRRDEVDSTELPGPPDDDNREPGSDG